MESLKQEAINVLSKIPDTAEIDAIVHRLYAIDDVRKGGVAIQRMEAASIIYLFLLFCTPGLPRNVLKSDA